MEKHQFLVRNVEAEKLLQIFLISAVTSLLGIRLYLKLTGFPTIGGSALHIAHVLFGGLLMLAAIVMMLTFLGKHSKYIAAVIGGLGFGAFIDELGKFVTHDNNYFYQPTIAIIYVIFIALYLLFDYISRSGALTKKEYLINALEMAKEAVHKELDTIEKRKALKMLKKAEAKDPIVRSVRAMMKKIDAIPPPEPNIFKKTAHMLHNIYSRLIRQKWFTRTLVWFFVIITINSLWNATGIVKGLRVTILAGAAMSLLSLKLMQDFTEMKKGEKASYLAALAASSFIFTSNALKLNLAQLSIIETGEFASSIAAGALVLFGIWKVKSSRMAAYRMFKYSVMVSIFLTQFFAFYREQLGAVVGLIGYVVIFAALEYVTEEEEHFDSKQRKKKN